MTKNIKANLYEISRFQIQRQENYRETAPYLEQPGHHCLHLLRTTQAEQETFFTDLASRQMKTKLFFSSQAGMQNLKFWRFHITH